MNGQNGNHVSKSWYPAEKETQHVLELVGTGWTAPLAELLGRCWWFMRLSIACGNYYTTVTTECPKSGLAVFCLVLFCLGEQAASICQPWLSHWWVTQELCRMHEDTKGNILYKASGWCSTEDTDGCQGLRANSREAWKAFWGGMKVQLVYNRDCPAGHTGKTSLHGDDT